MPPGNSLCDAARSWHILQLSRFPCAGQEHHCAGGSVLSQTAPAELGSDNPTVS